MQDRFGTLRHDGFETDVSGDHSDVVQGLTPPPGPHPLSLNEFDEKTWKTGVRLLEYDLSRSLEVPMALLRRAYQCWNVFL